jgi:hypothetical protein
MRRRPTELALRLLAAESLVERKSLAHSPSSHAIESAEMIRGSWPLGLNRLAKARAMCPIASPSIAAPI